MNSLNQKKKKAVLLRESRQTAKLINQQEGQRQADREPSSLIIRLLALMPFTSSLPFVCGVLLMKSQRLSPSLIYLWGEESWPGSTDADQ